MRFCKRIERDGNQCFGIQRFIGTSVHLGLAKGYQCQDCGEIEDVYPKKDKFKFSPLQIYARGWING